MIEKPKLRKGTLRIEAPLENALKAALVVKPQPKKSPKKKATKKRR